ncbi:hypothetical protein Zmor_011288 [Zophobas morio]|uniref:Uncharacterized protein n=1 Tax=Zophobas morio TaxID=2755281 RepID=A0AA38ISX2_9CUCU|nr:hypothetical protein Zmor_011288 [Zophobas morio]
MVPDGGLSLKSLHFSKLISNAASRFFLDPAIGTSGRWLQICLYANAAFAYDESSWCTARKLSTAISVVPGRRKGVFRNNTKDSSQLQLANIKLFQIM